MRTEWTVINPFSNPLIQSGNELADITSIEEFAERMAEEVYRSLFENDQRITVIHFAKKKFEQRYKELIS
jgi:hypothetical protein